MYLVLGPKLTCLGWLGQSEIGQFHFVSIHIDLVHLEIRKSCLDDSGKAGRRSDEFGNANFRLEQSDGFGSRVFGFRLT